MTATKYTMLIRIKRVPFQNDGSDWCRPNRSGAHKPRRHTTRNHQKCMKIRIFFVSAPHFSQNRFCAPRWDCLWEIGGAEKVKIRSRRSGAPRTPYSVIRSNISLISFGWASIIGRRLVELGLLPLIWSNISAADPAFRPQFYWHFGLESSKKLSSIGTAGNR